LYIHSLKRGIEVPLYEIQDIIVPDDIEVAMHRQASAERMRREVVKEAQAKKESHELESRFLYPSKDL
jgi:regulator of protease activity HflC (stomatin/prohibitin superfamily)